MCSSILEESHDNRKYAWNDYINICKVGGTKSFLELVKLANLRSPFEDGCIDSIMNSINGWFNLIDDKKL